MLAVVLVIINRIYVRVWLIGTVEDLCDRSQPPKRIISELKELVIIVNQYKWLQELSYPYQEEHLLKGLDLFSSGPETGSLPALDFIYRELFLVYDNKRQFYEQLAMYEQLIKLKLRTYRLSQRLLEPHQINEIFELEVYKAMCFCRALRLGQVNPDDCFNKTNEIIERLDQYSE